MNRRELLGAAATAAILTEAAATLPAQAQNDAIRVLCWSEHTEPREIYPNGIDGLTAEILNRVPGVKATAAALEDPDQGVPDSVLDNVDVIAWWGHQKHGQVRDDRVDAIVQRMKERGLGFLAMHSSHYSKVLKKALNSSGDLGGVGDGGREMVYVVNPKHPIAKGVKDFAIPVEEFYDEPFGIPEPHTVVFFSVFEKTGPNGEIRKFRSGAAFEVGKGRLFYFRPGHEAFRTYYQPEVQKVLQNSVLWLARKS
jgi:trehalose utilization protein